MPVFTAQVQIVIDDLKSHLGEKWGNSSNFGNSRRKAKIWKVPKTSNLLCIFPTPYYLTSKYLTKFSITSKNIPPTESVQESLERRFGRVGGKIPIVPSEAFQDRISVRKDTVKVTKPKLKICKPHLLTEDIC